MASSSKLLALTLTSSFLRSSLLPAPSRRLPTGPLLSLRFCSAAGDVADAPAAAAAPDHPWPEWGDFLEKLRAKGYFEQPTLASRADAAEGEVAATAAAAAAAGEDPGASADNYPSKDLNRLKNACLKFGRERFDLLRLFAREMDALQFIIASVLCMNWALISLILCLVGEVFALVTHLKLLRK